MNARERFMKDKLDAFRALGHVPLMEYQKGRWGFHVHCRLCGAMLTIKKTKKETVEFPERTCKEQRAHVASITFADAVDKFKDAVEKIK
jgi:hypothetical protein